MPVKRNDYDYVLKRIKEMSKDNNCKLNVIAETLTNDPNTEGAFSKSMIAYYMGHLRKNNNIGYRNQPWTDKEHNMLVNLYIGGVDIAIIARKLNRSIPAIHSRISQNNLANRKICPEKAEQIEALLLSGEPIMQLSITEGISYNVVRHIWSKIKVQTSKTNKPFNADKKVKFSSCAELRLRKLLEAVLGENVVNIRNNRDWSEGKYQIDIPIVLPWGSFAIEVNSRLHANKMQRDHCKRSLAESLGWIWLPVWFWDIPNKTDIYHQYANILTIINEMKKGNNSPFNKYNAEVIKAEKEKYYNCAQELYDQNAHINYGPSWPQGDLDILIMEYKIKSIEEIERLLSVPRTIEAIKHKARNLGIIDKRKTFSKEEDTIIKMYYPTSEKKDILNLLPKWSWSSIISRAHRLGISRKKNNS